MYEKHAVLGSAAAGTSAVGAFMHTSWILLASAMVVSTVFAGWRLFGGLRRRNAHQH
jgi:hypothetical protein